MLHTLACSCLMNSDCSEHFLSECCSFSWTIDWLCSAALSNSRQVFNSSARPWVSCLSWSQDEDGNRQNEWRFEIRNNFSLYSHHAQICMYFSELWWMLKCSACKKYKMTFLVIIRSAVLYSWKWNIYSSNRSVVLNIILLTERVSCLTKAKAPHMEKLPPERQHLSHLVSSLFCSKHLHVLSSGHQSQLEAPQPEVIK